MGALPAWSAAPARPLVVGGPPLHAALFAAAEEQARTAAALPPEAVGLAALGALLTLLAITWAFRSVGQRHGQAGHAGLQHAQH